jgi:small subunit ribosomal protein S2
MATDGTFDTLSKRERLQITRQRAKLEKNLGSIADLTRLPAAMFIVDVHKEYIAVKEANRLNIPVFAMVDTNSDPREIDFPIPANDDASKSISLIINFVTDSIAEGLNERRMEKEKEAAETKAKKAKAESPEDTKETEGRKGRSRKRAEKVEVKEESKEEKPAAKKEPEAAKKEEKAEVKAEEKAEETSDAKGEEKSEKKVDEPAEEPAAEAKSK